MGFLDGLRKFMGFHGDRHEKIKAKIEERETSKVKHADIHLQKAQITKSTAKGYRKGCFGNKGYRLRFLTLLKDKSGRRIFGQPVKIF